MLHNENKCPTCHKCLLYLIKQIDDSKYDVTEVLNHIIYCNDELIEIKNKSIKKLDKA
jgi:hypothetical protein